MDELIFEYKQNRTAWIDNRSIGVSKQSSFFPPLDEKSNNQNPRTKVFPIETDIGTIMVYLDNGGHLRQAPGSGGLRKWYDKRALVKIKNGARQYKVGGVARFYKKNNKYHLEYDSANEQWIHNPRTVKSDIFAPLKEKSELSSEFNENSNFKFSFERDLENHLVQNLGSLEEGLNIYSNNDKQGQQFNTSVGRIDILALDKKGDLVVIELKMGLVGSDVLAQIMPYVGWIEENLGSGKSVRAIIVGSDFDEKLKYAVHGLPITLKKYEVKFEFEDIKRITQ